MKVGVRTGKITSLKQYNLLSGLFYNFWWGLKVGGLVWPGEKVAQLSANGTSYGRWNPVRLHPEFSLVVLAS